MVGELQIGIRTILRFRFNLKDKCLSPEWYRTRLIEYYFLYYKKDVKLLNEIGNNFRLIRESSSVSLEEASADTEIPETALEQIEDGNIGSFKDIFLLKEYLKSYSKYLGLDPDKIIDEFNEYMFEYTSKIPLDDLEKKIAEKEREEEIEKEDTIEQAVSPYLKPQEDNSNNKMILTIVVIIILIAITLVWAIKQVMVGGV